MGNDRLHTCGYVIDSDQKNTNGERNNWGVFICPSITHECPNKFHKITSILNGVQGTKDLREKKKKWWEISWDSLMWQWSQPAREFLIGFS